MPWLAWPLFGRTKTLNAVARCASLNSIFAVQRQNEQVADTGIDLYGSEGWGFGSLRARPGHRPFAHLARAWPPSAVTDWVPIAVTWSTIGADPIPPWCG
jgi:hypothetical protein